MSTYFNKTQNGNTLFQKLNNVEERVAEIEENGTGGGSVATGVTNDVPQTLGEFYCVRKAQDLIAASAYLNNTMVVPAKPDPGTETLVAGDTLKGVPYSSTRKWNTFVPNHVSFETYFTALSDPNSYAYSIHPHTNTHEYLYYGSVCTVFMCYCLGIKIMRHTNREVFDIPGMEVVEVQDAQSMHIGYIINVQSSTSAHVRVCIGVKRNNGVVTHVTLADETSAKPNTRAIEYTAEEFNAMLDKYTILRYTKLEENTYEPLKSPLKMPFFNPNIMPARGNKSNWSNTENVVINVLDAGIYTSYIVYKDGSQHSTATLSGSSINLGVLPYGKYSMVLTDGTNKSAPVEWIVVDMHMTATARSGGYIRFAFSSKNAVPLACFWGTSDYMLNVTYEVDKKDIKNGYKDTKLSTEPFACSGIPQNAGKESQYDMWYPIYRNGKVYPRMFFETEFGIISTDWVSGGITYVE